MTTAYDHFLKNVYLHKFRAIKVLIDMAASTNPDDTLAWFGARQLLRDMRNMLVRKYAWAIPSTEAIEVIARYSPLVEVGGNFF